MYCFGLKSSLLFKEYSKNPAAKLPDFIWFELANWFLKK
jgi:hypothetical protein